MKKKPPAGLLCGKGVFCGHGCYSPPYITNGSRRRRLLDNPQLSEEFSYNSPGASPSCRSRVVTASELSSDEPRLRAKKTLVMHHKFQLSSVIRTLLAFPRVPSYSYKSLDSPKDSIRLVLLQPAPYLTSPIRCRVIETTLSQEKSNSSGLKGYAALSYTWGNPIPKSEIEIDGRPFEITKNLDLALRHLRPQRTELRLWADSISINQDDTEERNRHVRQMRSIYSAANETTIFLGEATEGSDVLLHAMNDAKIDIALATSKGAVVKALMNASGLSKRELIEKAFEIMWRRYWRRIWIFQEIVSSNNPWVQCGRVKVSWELFCQSLIALFHSDVKQWGAGYDNEPKRRLEDTYWERRAYRKSLGLTERLPRWDMASGHEFEGRTRLLDLLVTKRASEASDSRDMVFALAGIATKPADWDPVSITYEKSVSLVYMSVAKYLIEHDGTYEVLSHAGQHQYQWQKKIQPQYSHVSPSWAPDWRIPSDYKDKIVDWIPLPESKNLVAKNHMFLEEYGILVCIGQVFDRIHSISDREEVKLHPSSIGRVSWNKWHRRKLIEHGVLSHSGTKLATVTSLFARMHPLTYRRKLAETKGGTSCLVPRDAQEGDLICHFTGSPTPFILRPWGEGQWKRKDIGPCSKLVVKFLEWITSTSTRVYVLKYVDEKISDALKMKRRKENVEIQHYTLIGECFVDGLTSKKKAAVGGDETQEVAFALH